MSRAKAIINALIASPGMTMREVAVAIGHDPANTAVSAQLSQLAKHGKLRRDASGIGRGGRYWPTALANVDRRSDPGRARKRSTAAKFAAGTRAASRPIETRAAARQRAKAENAQAKPHPKPAPRFIQPPPPKSTRHGNGVETVAQFIARGGTVQRLHAHASSHPLKCMHDDHAQHRTGRVNRRKAGAQ